MWFLQDGDYVIMKCYKNCVILVDDVLKDIVEVTGYIGYVRYAKIKGRVIKEKVLELGPDEREYYLYIETSKGTVKANYAPGNIYYKDYLILSLLQ